MPDNDEHIILKWVGHWVLHQTSDTSYPTREAAEKEAANVLCRTLVLRVSDIANEMDKITIERPCHANGGHYLLCKGDEKEQLSIKGAIWMMELGVPVGTPASPEVVKKVQEKAPWCGIRFSQAVMNLIGPSN